MRAWLWLLAAFVSAGLASAAAQDTHPARLLTRPDPQAFSDHFPVVALARGVSGRAVLDCAVAPDGSSQCTAAEETPEGSGFGAAAVALAQGWRFRPHTEGGQPTASIARVPVEFQNPASEAAIIGSSINVDASRGPTAATSSDDARAAFYPEAARTANMNGRALVGCTVRSDQRLECAAERESPEGYGFGAAAVQLAQTTTGLDIGAVVRLPFDFALHDPRRSAEDRSYWAARPTSSDYAQNFPAQAMEHGINGRAILVCTIQADASLACVVGSEAPSGIGFGAAALRIARDFRYRAEELGQPGHAVGDRIQIPITFRVHS